MFHFEMSQNRTNNIEKNLMILYTRNIYDKNIMIVIL
jgi:hypothetical protein